MKFKKVALSVLAIMFLSTTVLMLKYRYISINLRKEFDLYKNEQNYYSADALFERAISVFGFKVNGVLHIGAHEGQELKFYERLGIKNILYIEADPSTYKILNENMKEKQTETNVKTYNFAALDKDMEIPFYVTNNGQSSSVLKLKDHKELHPSIHETNEIKVIGKRADEMIGEGDLKNVNALVVDVQGAEIAAIEGCSKFLNQIDFVVSEVNYCEVYSEGSKLEDLDSTLRKYGFIRIDTFSSTKGWGNALYIKSQFLNSMFKN